MSQWRSMSLGPNHYRNQRPSSSLMAPPSSPHPSLSPGPRRRLPLTPDQMEAISRRVEFAIPDVCYSSPLHRKVYEIRSETL
ncbi:hypothetical protein AAVH_33593 [Aphelenchoides avenae]|nr:hypothetical protein AAVH_33593 [Aphelenchus avenae]